MTAHEENLRTDGSVATDDAFGETDAISVEQDDADLLFSPEDRMQFSRRLTDVQSRFVDDPRDAVASADDLVGEMMDRIGRRVAERRSALGQQLAGEGEAETEDLRLAIQRYRAFINRLLSA